MAAIRLVPLAALGVVLAGCVGGNERRATSPDAPPDVSRAALRAHLTALEAAARRHGGTRAVGTPGYGASVDYVVRTLRAAGYGPRLDRFRLRVFRELGPPTMTRVRPSAMRFRHRRDFLTMSYSGSGSVTAAVQPVDVRLPPGRANSSTSGCERADFTRFPRGRIALLQRGRCFFSVKARNAQAAGARAVLVFNEGQTGRRDVLSATLGPGRVRIPVLGLSYRVGRSLALAALRRPVVVRVACAAGSCAGGPPT